MTETRYLSLADVVALHRSVMEHTGSAPAPVRDEGILESAIMRPRMVAYYEEADLIHQCVVLIIGISQAQGFVDGNKRTAFAAGDVFLRLNGYYFAGNPLELAKHLETVARHSDSLSEATQQFETWLRPHIQEKTVNNTQRGE